MKRNAPPGFAGDELQLDEKSSLQFLDVDELSLDDLDFEKLGDEMYDDVMESEQAPLNSSSSSRDNGEMTQSSNHRLLQRL